MVDPKIHHNNLINSIIAKMQATTAGMDDAVMLDQRGFVAETNATNLFTVAADAWHTPFAVRVPVRHHPRDGAGSSPRRTGITVTERDLSLTDFYTAEEVFCTGTMGEIAGVVQIDGRTIGDGEVGPVTGQIAQLYRDHARAHGVQVT